MEIEHGVEFPRDTSAKILTSGLLGDQYVGLEAGARREESCAGDTITQTQSAVVLENLIGQFLFNKAADAGSRTAAPAPAATTSAAGVHEVTRADRSRLCWRAAPRGGRGDEAAPPAERTPTSSIRGRIWNRNGVRVQRGARRARAEAGGRPAIAKLCPSCARRRQQLLRQLRRRLVGGQPCSCRASPRTA